MRDVPRLLVVVRHAESTRNLAKAGQTFFPDADARRPLEGEPDHDAGLTDVGRAQAREVGAVLMARFGVFDAVYHSGYRRTLDTVEGILAAVPEPDRQRVVVRESMFLRERDAGYAFNMTSAEADEAFPWLQDYWRTVGPIFSRPPGGESLADVAGRVQLFLESCERELAGRRVLLVTHSGTLRMMRVVLEGWSCDEAPDRWRKEPVVNGSFVAYSGESGQLALLSDGSIPTT